LERSKKIQWHSPEAQVFSRGVARGFVNPADTVLHQCIRPLLGAGCAPGQDFQNTKFRLADIKAQAVAVRLMIDHYLSEHMKRGLTLQESAIAKLFATETLGKAALDEMVQLHGGLWLHA
jgi:alkylation response protein AidB-like acyl-CoA dehydrogenase